MVTTKYVKSRNVCKVKFECPQEELPQDITIDTVAVAGEFNGWDPAATPMKYSQKKKSWSATVELEPAIAYQYRYVINGEHWENDWHAEEYIANGVNGDNCVVRTLEA